MNKISKYQSSIEFKNLDAVDSTEKKISLSTKISSHQFKLNLKCGSNAIMG